MSKYQKVFDGRGRRIRGLWKYGNKFLAQLKLEGGTARRIKLKAETLPQAIREQELLREQRDQGDVRDPATIPTFATFVKTYFESWPKNKAESTRANEESVLAKWVEHMGDTKLHEITPAQVASFINKRRPEVSGRTLDVHVTYLNCVLKMAKNDYRYIKGDLPTASYRKQAEPPAKRPLHSLETINKIIAGALATHGNGVPKLPGSGQQLADYLKLLYSCGCREKEGLRIKWKHVDWDKKQLGIGDEFSTKNGYWRVVDFNPVLEAHLKDMHSRRDHGSEWLFPALPEENMKRVRLMMAAKEEKAGKKLGQLPEDEQGRRVSFRDALRSALRYSELGADFDFGFHDLRHFYASHCVMSGVDLLTVAAWLGHRDTNLIARVYGHLANDHRQRMAQIVSLGGIRVLSSSAPAQPAVAA